MFKDRADAGCRLAGWLGHLRGREDVVVLGLARGGVPVAHEVAKESDVPLGLIAVRQMTSPLRPQLTIGALAEGGAPVVGRHLANGLDDEELARSARAARAELDLMVRRLRHGKPPPRLDGRTAVLIDDGLATGVTARAACEAAHARGALRVVLAAPVMSPNAVAELCDCADEVVRIIAPPRVTSIADFYEDFPPLTDDDILALLKDPVLAAGVSGRVPC
jgi:putative phosphoribosyl transferase